MEIGERREHDLSDNAQLRRALVCVTRLLRLLKGKQRKLKKMSVQSGRIVGYVLFNSKTDKFVGCDYSSGGYPWESNTIQSITIWPDENKANEFKLIPGFNSFGSSHWIVYPLMFG